MAWKSFNDEFISLSIKLYDKIRINIISSKYELYLIDVNYSESVKKLLSVK